MTGDGTEIFTTRYAMNPSASGAAERRVAFRFQMSFAAELAFGTVLIPVLVRDLSMAGCGVAIMGEEFDLPNGIGTSGLLHLPASNRGTYGTILPTVLRNIRVDGSMIVHGLEFRPLLGHQTRKLLDFVHSMSAISHERRH